MVKAPMNTMSETACQMVAPPLGKAAARLVHLASFGPAGSRPTAHLPASNSFNPMMAISMMNQPKKHAHQSSLCNTGGLSFPLLISSASFFFG